MRWGSQVVKSFIQGTSLVAQWLGLHASKARGVSLIPGGELRSESHAVQSGKKKKVLPTTRVCDRPILLSPWLPPLWTWPLSLQWSHLSAVPRAGCVWSRQAWLLTAPALQVSAVTVLKFVIIFEQEVPQSHSPPAFRIKRWKLKDTCSLGEKL